MPTSAALCDRNEARGVSADGAPAALGRTAALAQLQLALLPGIGAEDGSVGGRETGVEPAGGGGGGVEVASGALTPWAPFAKAEPFDLETGLSGGSDFEGGLGRAACLDTGPTVLSAALVVFWSAPVLDVASAPALEVASRGAALTVLTTAAAVDGTDGATGVEGADGVDGAGRAEGVEGADGVDGAGRAEGVEGADGVDGAGGTEGVEGLCGAAGGTPLPVACVAVATVWPAARPTSWAPPGSGFAVAGPAQTNAASRPSATPLAT
jgi:hypothetical protein